MAASRRTSSLSAAHKRVIAVVGTLAMFGGIIAVTQVSNAQDNRTSSVDCPAPVPGADAPEGAGTTVTRQNGRQVRHHWGDGQECGETTVATLAAGDTVVCPSVADRLPRVPGRARGEVDRNLALLETQIQEANRRLASSQGEGGPAFVDNAILGPLAGKRTATIDRIEIAFSRVGERPRGLGGLANCSVTNPGNNGGDGQGDGNNNGDGGNNGDGDNNGGDNNGDGQGDGNNDGDQGGNDNGGDNDQGGGLDILANNCDDSQLQAHNGFQDGNRCVSTAFGEVGSRDRNPTLLITQSPDQVDVNQPFSFRVSTRNLVRDRFLAAAQGGYYVESSVLDGQGLTRGHFHSSCRLLANDNEAPSSDPVPEFFVATEDGGGGAQPDQIDIQVGGLPTAGLYQCSSWAGDGSHRIPMMQAANQTPAFDSFRLQVG
ncbi:hypothetical protein O7627_31515 [Solwaraspora sp. WMMD1047]|uniref:hypothetical protein n=1 Tax=Solwaraspora sp. WMMD1047 TaxID=3016102 RepID=UPI0024177A7B|nr:hypothetical protein [Solwaraspora sp. WMMD1047]MDG4833808.1 hypothetical protein [Solwaraspora sp. WMMD1047]